MSSMIATEPGAGVGRNLRWHIVAVFGLQGIVLAMLNMRLPDLQLRAYLSDANFGLVLMGGPIGALVSFAGAARLVEVLGTRRLDPG